MEDQDGETGSHSQASQAEPVRSRWTPKPEQILILESIFNSGMVNPPKDETVRIRKLLEKFGPVGDANVFYWFQNRRSRSRRRQRQIQASQLSATGDQPIHCVDNLMLPAPNSMTTYHDVMNTGGSSGSSSSFGLDATSDGLLSFSFYGPPDTSNLHHHSGLITVFINGVATEVGRGVLNVKAMFGGDYGLVHSSGAGVEVNEHGYVVQRLQHGESYFLVPRNS